MQLKESKKIKYIAYLGVTLLTFFVFYLQILNPDIFNLLFLIFFMVIFFAVAELFGIIFGIYTALLTVSLQFFYAELFAKGSHVPYYLVAFLEIGLVIYYFLIKKVKEKKYEETSAKEKYFRKLINLSLQPIILKNKDGEIQLASESIKDLLDLKKTLPFGKNIRDFIHPKDINKYNIFFEKVLNSPNKKVSTEFRVNKGNSYWIWVRNDAINLLETRDIKAIVSSLHDITSQKELDREKVDIIKQEKYARALAEKAIKDRDEFLSIASHELKTPLTTVILQLQVMLRKISTQTLADFSGLDLLNSLQIAEKQSQTLATLIKDLLNVSLASTGRLTLNKDKVNLCDLVKSLSVKYAEEIKLSKCRVVTIIKNREVIGNWDFVRIEQAISNLFLNAIKFSGGKKVTIIAKSENGWGIFQVRDRGIGIAEDLQSEIFEPFKRGNNNSSIKGLGVGLFIAKQIAEAHGGYINVKSSLGKGSTFTLKLPLLVNAVS